MRSAAGLRRAREGLRPRRVLAVVDGDQVATVGENRKMVIFPLEQMPEMTRGSGVRIQRYKDGGLSDVKTFKAAEGLTWLDSAGNFLEAQAQLRRLSRRATVAGNSKRGRTPCAESSEPSPARRRRRC